jgi:hypothetical protein
VRGAIKLRGQDCENPFQIGKHVVVPESGNPKAVFREPSVAFQVSSWLGMLTAVDFYDQSRFEAEEVGDVRSDRDLTSKLECLESAISQCKPELSFGVGHL